MSSDEVPEMQTAAHSASPNLKTAPVLEATQDCIDSAHLCCLRAQEAAGRGRMGAAHGLLQTAITLYERAAREYPGDAFSSRLDRLVSDLCLTAQILEIEGVVRQTTEKEREA